MLFKVTNTVYPKSHLNHTVNTQSEIGLSRVAREKVFQQIMKGKQQDFMWLQGLYLPLLDKMIPRGKRISAAASPLHSGPKGMDI